MGTPLRTSFFALMLGMAGAKLHAEELPAERIAHDALWVLHLDVERFRASPLFEEVRRFPDFEPTAREAEQVRDAFGFDFVEDLHGITLYAAGADREDTVILLTVSHAEELVRWLGEGRPGFSVLETEVAGETAFIVTDGRIEVFAKVLPLDEEGQSLVVAAHPAAVEAQGQAELLAGALAVVRGERDSLATEGAQIRVRPRKGSFVFTASVDARATVAGLGSPEVLTVPSIARFVESTQELMFDFGEEDATTRLFCGVEFENAGTAFRLQMNVLGFQALVHLLPVRGEALDRVRASLSRLELSAREQRFALRFEEPTESLVETLALLRSADPRTLEGEEAGDALPEGSGEVTDGGRDR